MNPAVVFDLDGTLVDSLGSVAAAVNAALAQEGLVPLSLANMRPHVGEGAVHMLTSILQAYDVEATAEVVARCVERYVKAYLDEPTVHTKVFPHVFDVLEELRARGCAMGVCTNKPGPLADAVLDGLGLRPFFSAVVSPDDTPFRKPDGRHILATLEEMKASKTGAMLVGDSETDVSAGRDAGLFTVLVTYGYSKGGAAEKEADVIIDSFDGLIDVLNRHAGGKIIHSAP